MSLRRALSPRRFFAASAATALVCGTSLAVIPPAAANTPQATVKLSATPFEDGETLPLGSLVGQDTTWHVQFDNTSGDAEDIGYGPYMDLLLPSGGDDGDDGVTFKSASYLSAPVMPEQVISCTGNPVTHPLTFQNVPCPENTQLVVLPLPFGSFVPNQPAAELDITTTVSPHLATGYPVDIVATGGYQYGDSATGADPVVGDAATTTFTGDAVRFTKRYNGPEDETATGPSFPQTYTLTADVAEGFTLTDFALRDELPETMQFTSILTITDGGTATELPPTDATGGLIAHTWPTLVGSAADVDAELTFEFYVPKTDGTNPILDPTTGDDRELRNDASWTAAQITPVDPDDTSHSEVSHNPNHDQTHQYPDDHRITAKSIAVQKTADTDQALPGQTVTYTVTTQVSDYFTAANTTFTDVVPDGLAVDSFSVMTLTADGTTIDVPLAPQVDVHTDCAADNPGATVITTDVPQELLPAATTLLFSYQTTVLDAYRCTRDGANVSSVDPLNNAIDVATTLGATVNGAPVTANETDDSHHGINVAPPTLAKSVYAVNGRTDLAPGAPDVYVDDHVTYRLQYTVPSGDLQHLQLSDFLPLPVYELDALTAAADQCTSDTVPAHGVICYGPADTAHTLLGALPAPRVDAAANSFALDFGTLTNPSNAAVTLDLLFTVRTGDRAFVDGLLLTNTAQTQFANNEGREFSDTAIAQITLRGPALEVRKGLVSSTVDGGDGVFYTGAAGGPLGVPGDDCPAAALSSPLTSATLAPNWPGADLSGVDSGDAARFAIVVRNTGGGDAYNVRLSDVIDTGLLAPAGNTRFCVTNGAGQPVAHDLTGNTETGFTLSLKNGSDSGAIAAQGAGDPGADILVITYDLAVPELLPPHSVFTNTATIEEYAAVPDGADFAPLTPTPHRSDSATLTTATINAVKEFVESDQEHSPWSQLLIGEHATYEATFTIPEGDVRDVTITDVTAPELQVVSLDEVRVGSALTISEGDGLALKDTVQFSADGHQLSLHLGDVTNSDRDPDRTDETITLRYTTRLLNTGSATNGKELTNVAQIAWGDDYSRASARVWVAEPQLIVTKEVTPAQVDAGDVVTYTLVVEHHPENSLAGASDVTLSDTLPEQLTYVPGSAQVAPGSVAPSVAPKVTDGVLTATISDLGLGERFAIQVQGTLNDDLPMPSDVPNTATVTWSSLPGDDVDGERDGSGGINNYRNDATATIDAATGTITKAVTDTSADHTDGTTVAVGEEVTYALTVDLPEGQLLEGFTVTDTLPDGLTLVPGSDTVAMEGMNPANRIGDITFTADGSTLTWRGGESVVDGDNNPDNDTVVFTVTAVVADSPDNTGYPATALTNTATLVVGDGTPVTTPATTVTVTEPAVDLVKQVSPTTTRAGGVVEVTVQAHNTGPVTAFNATVTDQLPTAFDSATVTAVSADCGFTFAASGANVTYTGGTIAAGDVCTVVFSAAVAGDVTPNTEVTNDVTGTFDSLPTGGRTSDASPGRAVLGVAAPDLKIVKTADATDAGAGDTLTYTLTVTNNGGPSPAGDATDIVITDTLAKHTTLVGTGGDQCVADAATPTGTARFTVASLPSGATVACTVTVQVADTLPAGIHTLANTATVTDPASDYTDPTPEDNDTTHTVPVGPSTVPDLAVAKTDNLTEVTAGAPVTYTVTVTNEGTIGATGVHVTDTLSGLTEYASCTVADSAGAAIDGAGCAHSGGVVTATVPVLEAGDTATLTISATVADVVSADADQVVNRVTVTDDGAHGPDGNDYNNVADDTTDLVAVPDMAITKSDGVDTATVGDQLTYQLTVSNDGTRSATGVTVTDTLPEHLEFVSCAPACDSSALPAITWTDVTEDDPAGPDATGFDAGYTATLTVVATVAGEADVYINTATVSDDGTRGVDPTPGNNTATDTNGAQAASPAADLAITKATTTPVISGGDVSYEVVVSNNGPASVTELTVTDDVPPGFSGVTFAPSEGSYDPVTGIWTDLTLAAGDHVTLVVTGTLDPAVQGPVSNTVRVTAPDGVIDPVPGNNTATVTDTATLTSRISLTKELVGQLRTGDVATYLVTVRADGPSQAVGVAITDALPAGLELVSASGNGWMCTGARCERTSPMAPGTESVITVQARVVAAAGTDVTNVVSMEPTPPGADPSPEPAPTASVVNPVVAPTPTSPGTTAPPSPTGSISPTATTTTSPGTTTSTTAPYPTGSTEPGATTTPSTTTGSKTATPALPTDSTTTAPAETTEPGQTATPTASLQPGEAVTATPTTPAATATPTNGVAIPGRKLLTRTGINPWPWMIGGCLLVTTGALMVVARNRSRNKT